MWDALDIGIAGAGMGGLAAAALLHDHGHRVTVFDRFDAPRPVGSGLVIQPVGQAVLARIGALAAAAGMGRAIRRMAGHEAKSGRPVLDVSYDDGTGRHGLAIHRAALFETLWQAVTARGIPVRTEAEVTGREGGHILTGTTRHGPFDLIVDATGVGSPLSPLKSRPLPYGAIWATVDWPTTDLPPGELRQCYRRADRMIGVLPIGTVPGQTGDKAALFWSLPRDGHDQWRDRGLAAWRDEATALWPEVAPFVEQITDPAQMTMARYSHGTLFRPYDDGIAHIGDAAHRASPQLGQGANMALLDAEALAEAIAQSRSRAALPDALLYYARARRAHVGAYQLFSAAFTPQYQSDSRVLPWLRDRLLFPLSQMPPVPRILSALVAGTMLPPLGSLTPQGRVRTAETSAPSPKT